MWDKEGSGFLGVKGLRDGTKYIHLCYWNIIAEDAVEVSILDAISEIKKKWRSVLRVKKLKTMVWLS